MVNAETVVKKRHYNKKERAKRRKQLGLHEESEARKTKEFCQKVKERTQNMQEFLKVTGRKPSMTEQRLLKIGSVAKNQQNKGNESAMHENPSTAMTSEDAVKDLWKEFETIGDEQSDEGLESSTYAENREIFTNHPVSLAVIEKSVLVGPEEMIGEPEDMGESEGFPPPDEIGVESPKKPTIETEHGECMDELAAPEESSAPEVIEKSLEKSKEFQESEKSEILDETDGELPMDQTVHANSFDIGNEPTLPEDTTALESKSDELTKQGDQEECGGAFDDWIKYNRELKKNQPPPEAPKTEKKCAKAKKSAKRPRIPKVTTQKYFKKISTKDLDSSEVEKLKKLGITLKHSDEGQMVKPDEGQIVKPDDMPENSLGNQDNVKKPKKTPNFINSRYKDNPEIGTLKDNQHFPINDNFLKAELLSDAFSKVFTTDNNISTVFPSRTNYFLDSMAFEPSVIEKIVSKLSPKCNTTPDEIPAIFLKNVCTSIAIPLSIIFSESFRTSRIPKLWKTAIVKPLHKKGARTDANNYRPISLTSSVCKVMEKLVRKNLTDYLNHHRLFSNFQFGFRSKMSTESQLTSYSTTLISNHSAKKATHSVYIDFKKAFDTVSFNKLACKLISYGVKGRLLDWIVSFLTDRTQRVNVNGVLSQERTVLSGVPQGSVLGPLLFLLFINDIGDEFKSDFLLYADDLKLFSTNPTTIVSDLKLLSIWCDKWQMSKSNAVEKIRYQFKEEDIIYGKRTNGCSNAEYKNEKRSKCLIVKIGKLEDDESMGSDVENLAGLFSKLNYQVNVVHDLTKKEIEDTVKRFGAKTNHGDSAVLAFVTHGCKDGVYGTDGKVFRLDQLYELLSPENSPQLAGKPKVIFAESCRGSNRDSGYSVVEDLGEDQILERSGKGSIGEKIGEKPEKIPMNADFLFCYSTSPGHVAFAHPRFGAYHVQLLCRTIAQRAHEDDLETMMVSVRKGISEMNFKGEKGPLKQMPEHRSSLRRSFYFNLEKGAKKQ
ncbi:hypothetical protein B9Z55_016107 [Caenorhabditis nigoni]|uniref:Reverse transcriptase domain-containing protein n=1 Tax=Caenorhabditis nigoni TaxID=1611254 RepID=A0A2G5UD64_9PELO|nr:hypothetical protein B9Z55_016107 [Caenorhabditis nigoni]